MPRTVTVKGAAKLSVKPDRTEISFSVRGLEKKYGDSVKQAGKKLALLREALKNIGFGEDDLKTEGFFVNPEYESVCDEKGRYRSEFAGYACVHQLKLGFDADSGLLGNVLNAVAESVADPQMNIRFTVRDTEAVKAELLRLAAKNAKAKAEILAEASEVRLGKLLSVDYGWQDMNFVSPTRFAVEEKCMAPADCAGGALNVCPDDIEVTDSVTFVWEIA